MVVGTLVSGVLVAVLAKLCGVARLGAAVTVAAGAATFGASALGESALGGGSFAFCFEVAAFGFAGVTAFLSQNKRSWNHVSAPQDEHPSRIAEKV